MKTICALLICCALAACISLPVDTQRKLNQLEAVGIPETDMPAKSAGAAGALNILPGFGNFYVAIGTNHNEQLALGVVNFLFWPLSVIWAAPQAAIDANTANKLATVRYYFDTEEGKAKFAEASTQHAGSK